MRVPCACFGLPLLLLSAAHVTRREAIRGSLERLGVDNVDLYYQHRWVGGDLRGDLGGDLGWAMGVREEGYL